MDLEKHLSAAVNEKDIENSFRAFLLKKFPDLIFESFFKSDGYAESKKNDLRLLCEFKDDKDLTDRKNQIITLCQVLIYIKKFELSGKKLPNIVLVADKNECFVIHTNDLFPHLDLPIDWSIPASNAHTNQLLFNSLFEDENINPFVFLNDGIEFCVEKIYEMNKGIKRLVPITPHNITDIFFHFETKVIDKTKLTTNELANLFVQLLINPDENYLHPVKKRKTIVTKAFNEVSIKSREAFTSFFSHFSDKYSPKQKEQLTAVVDRLIQDVTRRKQGEFFTPTPWVDKAHEYIASVYGDDWKEKYVVWDCAWGTGNLTRDYKFKELYASTLHYSDIQTAEQMGYNNEAIKFQFDFLNDPIDYLPKNLKESLKSKKEFIFFINPPYASSGNLLNGKYKKGLTKTEIGKEMNFNGLGKDSQQIYNQFIYRILMLGISNICMFTPPLYLSGSSSKKLRKTLLEKYDFVKGFMMDAKNFSDVKSWGLTFSILREKKNINQIICNDWFQFDVLEIKNSFLIEKVSEKKIYNTDNKIPLSSWVKDKSKEKFKEGPFVSSPFNVKEKGDGKIKLDSIGYLHNNSNNVYKSSVGVAIFSTSYSDGHGTTISENNFFESVTTLASRKLIPVNWINQKDEFIAPLIQNDFFKEFKYDSLIFSLFNVVSNQSSLRQIEYKNRLWDIKNQFFWLSKSEMMELANTYNYTELYNDARTDEERYVYKLLFGEEKIYDKLSPEAKDVLDTATELVKVSIPMRVNFADTTNHLNSWDAGYAQLKLLWKEFYPEQFKQFRERYKVLEDKMRPMVYELGFLLK